MAEIAGCNETGLECAEERWGEVLWLPCRVTVALRVAAVTIRGLLNLEVGSVLSTTHHEAADVPVMVNGQLIAWGKFQVSGDRLAVEIVDVV